MTVHKVKNVAKRSDSFARSTLLIVASEIAYRFLAFFAFVLLSRALGVKAFGEYCFIFSFLSFFDILAALGTNSIVLREMASNTAASGNILKNAIFLRSVCTAVSIFAACGIALCLHVAPEVKTLLCMGSIGLFVSYRPIVEGVFKLRMKMGIPAGIQVAKALLFLGFTLGIVFLSGGLSWFVIVSVMVNLAGTVALMLMAFRQVKPLGRIEWNLCRDLLKESLPMLFSGILTIFYMRLSVMLLTFLQGFESVGIYSTATKLSEALVIIPNALMATIFPVLSECAKHDRSRFAEILAQGFLSLMVFVVPVAIILNVYSASIVEILFRSKYAASAQALSILVWSCVFIYPNIIMVNAVIALRKQIIDTWFSLLSLALNILFNLWWIPRYGFLGSAWASVGAEAAQFVCLALYLSKVQKIDLYWGKCLRLIGVAWVFYVAARIGSSWVPWPIAISVFIGLYMAVLFILGILKSYDRRFLWDIVVGGLGFRNAEL